MKRSWDYQKFIFDSSENLPSWNDVKKLMRAFEVPSISFVTCNFEGCTPVKYDSNTLVSIYFSHNVSAKTFKTMMLYRWIRVYKMVYAASY